MVTGPRVATVTAALSRAIGAFAIAAMIASAWWAVASVADAVIDSESEAEILARLRALGYVE